MPDYGHDLLFGIVLTPDAHRPEHTVETAMLSEQLGLDLVSVPDHPYQPGFLDAPTLLTWIAARTSRIRLFANVAFDGRHYTLDGARPAGSPAQVDADGEQGGAESAHRGGVARAPELVESSLGIVVGHDPRVPGSPASPYPQAHPRIGPQIGDVTGMAALFGHDPHRLVDDVHADDRAPPLASAATDGLDQRVTRSQSEIHAELHRRVEKVLLQHPHAAPPARLLARHGRLSTMNLYDGGCPWET
jgi:hypothetical protein